jgi:DNA-binding transcriptional MerR regulator
MELTISKIGAEVGLTADTVRYYEKAGLLPPPARTSAGYRVYGEDAIERLRFIRGVQRFGLRLREIRELLEVLDLGACLCGHAEKLVEKRIREIEHEIDELAQVKTRLVRLRQNVRSMSRDPATGRWPCERQFLEITAGGGDNDGAGASAVLP